MSNVKKPDDGIGVITTVSAFVLAGGVVFTLIGGRSSRCAGARRSVRLEFEQRQQAQIAALNDASDECGDIGKTSQENEPDNVR